MSVNNYRKCAKCGRTRAEDMTVTYHRFPNPGTTNITRARVWAKYCWPNEDWTSIESLHSLYNRNKVLCGRHFSSIQFIDDKRQKLSKFAVPESDIVEEVLNERENIFNQNVNQSDVVAAQPKLTIPTSQIENVVKEPIISTASSGEHTITDCMRTTDSISSIQDAPIPKNLSVATFSNLKSSKKRQTKILASRVIKVNEMTPRKMKFYKICKNKIVELIRLPNNIKNKKGSLRVSEQVQELCQLNINKTDFLGTKNSAVCNNNQIETGIVQECPKQYNDIKNNLENSFDQTTWPVYNGIDTRKSRHEPLTQPMTEYNNDDNISQRKRKIDRDSDTQKRILMLEKVVTKQSERIDQLTTQLNGLVSVVRTVMLKVFVVKYIICENFNCLAITVLKIQPGDGWTDSEVSVIFCLIFPLAKSSKKYDLETESSRLYGENFNSILDRFRRTPAYLSIIKEKYKDMMMNLHSIATPISQSIEKTIDARVAEIVGYTNLNGSETVRSKPHIRHKSRKQVEGYGNGTVSPVQILDGYELLHRRTSTNERNKFKDLGFEMAQKMAHSVIRAMGPVDGTTAAFEENEHTTGTKVPTPGDSGENFSTKGRSAYGNTVK